jgi:hypothetical protein
VLVPFFVQFDVEVPDRYVEEFLAIRGVLVLPLTIEGPVDDLVDTGIAGQS